MKLVLTVVLPLLLYFATVVGCAPADLSAGLVNGTETSERVADSSSSEPDPPLITEFDLGSIGPGEQKAYSYDPSSGDRIRFWLYLPEGYDSSISWPLILSLHGYTGNEPSLSNVRTQSPPEYRGAEVELPFIVVSPQVPDGPWSQIFGALDELVADLSSSLSIKDGTHFLTGLSSSTPAVWEWAIAAPDRFAGIAVVAGTASVDAVTEKVCVLRELPVWIAHSELDELPIASHRAAAQELEDCGSTTVQFTVYSDLDHLQSIERAFEGPELYDWMINFQK